jgi:hypothetical protein
MCLLKAYRNIRKIMRWQATIYRLMSMSEKPAEYYSLFPQIYEVNQYHIFKNGRSSYFRCCSLNNLNSPSPKETVILALFHDFLEWEASGPSHYRRNLGHHVFYIVY